MLFPRDVFRVPGKNKAVGFSFDCLLCDDRDAHDAALKAGWFASMYEAIAGEVAAPAPADDKPPTRAELEAEAKKLGVKLDSRNNDERLAERILEAMDAATKPAADEEEA